MGTTTETGNRATRTDYSRQSESKQRNMKSTLTSALAFMATTDAFHVAFESPASRYGNYVPDETYVSHDPFLTTKCGLRGDGPFPSTAATWTSGSKPCITVKEVGPRTIDAIYQVSVLDATGASVYEEVIGTEPLGNDLASLRQALDAKTGLPVFEWCAEDDYAHYEEHHPEDHKRNCQPRNDLVVAHRRVTLSLPADLECSGCTLQLEVQNGEARTYACANVDVVASQAVQQDERSVCVSDELDLGPYIAEGASRFVLRGWLSLWLWTIVSVIIARILIMVWAMTLGHRAVANTTNTTNNTNNTNTTATGGEDELPQYNATPTTNNVKTALDPENPEAALLTEVPNADVIVITPPSNQVSGHSGCSRRGRCQHRQHGQCPKSKLCIGLEMRGPRTARKCVRGVCGVLAVAYVLVGIIAALAFITYSSPI